MRYTEEQREEEEQVLAFISRYLNGDKTPFKPGRKRAKVKPTRWLTSRTAIPYAPVNGLRIYNIPVTIYGYDITIYGN